MDLHNIGIHRAHILRIQEDKSLLGIIAKRNDILNVIIAHADEIVVLAFFPEEFLIVGDLDYERHVEGLLEILVEDEGQHVA